MEKGLFDQAFIAGIRLPNRIIRTATHEGLADADGFPTERLTKRYLQLARGGVGAIITGFAAVMKNGRSGLHSNLMIDRDVHVDAYRRVVESVHAYGTPIVLQIVHCGRQTRMAITGEETVAPSPLRDGLFSETVPKELTEPEIFEVIEAFVRAVERAKQAGFDGVQIHAAHGYLLSSFLSGYTNRRRDRWGGSLENRFRIIAEIYEQARQRVGDFPILAKINGYDGRRGGMRIGDAVEIARMLERSGCAAVEVSCGTNEDGLYTVRSDRIPVDAAFTFMFKYRRLPSWAKALARPWIPLFQRPVRPIRDYNVPAAGAIKKSLGIPVIAVGGIRTLDSMNGILTSGRADFVGMCRPFIREPSFANSLKEGRQIESRCTSCSICMFAMERESLRCFDGRVPRATRGQRE